MGNRARTLLAVYLAVMFATLPFLPKIVVALNDRLGEGPVLAALRAVVACCIILPALNLLRPPRIRPPLPHLAYAGLVLGALAALRHLASSPIAQIHLAEYAVLAVLIINALPAPRRAVHYGTALACAALVGAVDEAVQYYVPNRFFDPWDIALNAAAAALGVLAAAWWTWTGNLRRERGDTPSGDGRGASGAWTGP